MDSLKQSTLRTLYSVGYSVNEMYKFYTKGELQDRTLRIPVMLKTEGDWSGIMDAIQKYRKNALESLGEILYAGHFVGVWPDINGSLTVALPTDWIRMGCDDEYRQSCKINNDNLRLVFRTHIREILSGEEYDDYGRFCEGKRKLNYINGEIEPSNSIPKATKKRKPIQRERDDLRLLIDQCLDAEGIGINDPDKPDSCKLMWQKLIFSEFTSEYVAKSQPDKVKAKQEITLSDGKTAGYAKFRKAWGSLFE
jgi:hypothetical protein